MKKGISRKKQGVTHFYIELKHDSSRDDVFTSMIYDENHNLRYKATGSIHKTRLIDPSTNKAVGEVKHKFFTFRIGGWNPLKRELGFPEDFTIFANGIKLGKVKSHVSLINPHFQIEYKNWYMKYPHIGINKVFEGDNLIAEISYDRIELYRKNEEIVCMLLYIVIVIYGMIPSGAE